MLSSEERLALEEEKKDLYVSLTSAVSPIGDWKITKMYEYSLAGLEAPYDIKDLNEKRQAARDRINEINTTLESDNAESNTTEETTK